MRQNEAELPAPGVYKGRVTGFKDLGLIPTPYGQLHKVVLSFQIESDRKPRQVDRTYTYSLDRRSHLARDISSLLGHPPSPDFNPKELIGTPCQLQLNIETYPDQTSKVRILGIFPAQPCDSTLLDGFSIEIKKRPSWSASEVFP